MVLMAFFVALMLMALLGLALIGFWVWMLVDSLMNSKLTEMQRAIWVLVIITTNLIGAFVYFFVGRSPRVPSAPVFYAQPRPVQRPVEVPHPYQEGYQPREARYSARQEAASQNFPPAENIPQGVEYEQMQISYPEEK